MMARICLLDKSKTSKLQDFNNLEKIILFYSDKRYYILLGNEQCEYNILNLKAMTVMEMVMQVRLLDRIPFGLSPASPIFNKRMS